MSLRRTIVSLLTSAWLAGSVAGAMPQVFQNLEFKPPIWIPVAPPEGIDSYRQTLPGDFDGDGFADVILQYSHGATADLDMVFAPGLFQVDVTGIAYGAHDLAVEPGADPSAPSTLITVGPLGLRRHWWTDDPLHPSHWDAAEIGTSEWHDGTVVGNVALHVQNGTPRVVRYVGTKWSGSVTTVLQLIATDGQMTVGAPFYVPWLVRDLQFFQDDLDGEPELSFMTGNRILVYDRGANGLWTQTKNVGTAPSHACTPVHVTNSPVERILWFNQVSNSNATEQLHSLVGSSVFEQETFESSPDQPGVVGCARGRLDEDDDDDEDLIYNASARNQLEIFLNVTDGTEPEFTAGSGNPMVFDYGATSPPQNKGQPAAFDADNDGDLDICFPLLERAALWYIETAAAPAVPPSSLVVDGPGGTLSVVNGQWVAHFTARGPDVAGSMLQVLTWRRASPLDDIEPAYDVTIAPRTGSGGGQAEFSVDVPLREWTDDSLYFLLVRSISAGGAVAEPRFPARFYAIRFDGEDGPWDLYLEGKRKGDEYGLSYELIGQPLGTVCEVAGLFDFPTDSPPRPRQNN